METEIIDRLFLELSQFTKAKTETEVILGIAVERAFKAGLRAGSNEGFSMSNAQEIWEGYRDYNLQEVAEHLKSL